MTKEEILKYAHISTSEIEQDLLDTNNEQKDFEDEKNVLMRNPSDNKVRIYMLGGHISKREGLSKRLNEILNYRLDR